LFLVQGMDELYLLLVNQRIQPFPAFFCTLNTECFTLSALSFTLKLFLVNGMDELYLLLVNQRIQPFPAFFCTLNTECFTLSALSLKLSDILWLSNPFSDYVRYSEDVRY
jgi:hypothetical protein